MIKTHFHKGIIRADRSAKAFRSGIRPLVVFTHHFGGQEHNMWRHVELVNKLGFDAITFTFSWHGEKPRYTWPIGLHHRWASEIAQVLDQYPDRNKILYSFSGPCASALECIADRMGRRKFDVVALVCDSGPFADPWYCTRLMLQQVKKMKPGWRLEARLSWMMLSWGLRHRENLKAHVKRIMRIRADLPILSIRGAKDTIVPPEQIHLVFRGFELPRLTIEVFEKSGHLTALKQEPERYRDVVEWFFLKITDDETIVAP